MDFEVKMPNISLWVAQNIKLVLKIILRGAKELKGDERILYHLANKDTIKISNLGLHLLWLLLHLIVSAWYFAVSLTAGVEDYLISSGILKHYNSLNLDKLRNLAIVIESEEACDINKVVELIKWLKAIGVKNVCLYDAEGVLNKAKEAILEKINDKTSLEETAENDLLGDQRDINITFASIFDGKEAIVKAANVLFLKYCNSADSSQDNERIFSEQQINEALLAVGCGGPNPELLLVYGPARCHLGFPPWRIPYTEIVHMGSLKSMNYGSLMKAIFKFTKVRQNYGK